MHILGMLNAQYNLPFEIKSTGRIFKYRIGIYLKKKTLKNATGFRKAR